MPSVEESSPRRKEPQVSQQKASQDPLAEPPLPETKNSFAVLQEDEVQEPEVAAVQELGIRDPSSTLEAVSPKPASLGLKKDPIDLGGDSSAQVGLASLVPSTEETSDSEDFSAPSPPLTRGRKTNKEHREKEAASNISAGSQKKLDPFIKGHSSLPV